MAKGPEEAARLHKRVYWRPFPILDSDHDDSVEVATVRQQIFDTNIMKIQKEENQWTFYSN